MTVGARALLWVLLASLVASCSKASPGHSSSASSSTVPSGAVPVAIAPPPSAPPPPPIVRSEGMPGSFAPLARRADPAVATVKARVERQQQPGGRRRTVAEGLGTAFVYDPEGFLLTNNHVIEGATDILVSFVDGRDIKATVIGRDKHTDVAVLKVDEKGLPSLPLGDSDTTEVGDWVVAIGNPFGLSHTVSAGILSAKGRTRDDVKGLDPSGYFNFLQTDASINPGNSGGPLLNLKGEVVGINAAVRANANNIGFAIPINMVRQLLPMLLRDGKIRRSQVGVIVDVLNSIEAGRLKRPDRKGAWVKTVVAGGPADRAGIAPDDVIIGFEGKTISDPNELRWMASIAGVNKVVTLRVARLERVFDVRLTLGELPELSDEADEP
ncbi:MULTISPECIES: S1C family serine protease [Sorangium]|uniref:Serine protease, HtrA/DegQ/DegS family n=1 Tax=Sorangium cellulosum (strain So ce56) TaxID=448385 RepID=A9ESJ0_SORC5|nr:trypsin-like peptidase domain-containing protein [Sorangium cellulosum]CAN97391.1 serine protease, HtrA/DegQ/DegS family [Sorangium cellulosum So ce56]